MVDFKNWLSLMGLQQLFSRYIFTCIYPYGKNRNLNFFYIPIYAKYFPKN